MDNNEPQSSHMRVAIVSASRTQRETLKNLIEDNGQQVIGTAGFRDYFLRQEQLDPDVLLVDLDKADDDALDRLDRLVEQSKVPILFNESPTIPTTPGPYRDEWANNLIGKLHDLANRERTKLETGLLDRPRYNTRGAHAFPKVLVVSRSKTRRRVIQLVLMNQGFRDVDEIAYTPDLLEKRIASYGAIVADEHGIGLDTEAVFNALISQTQTPVQICNSSTVPAVPSARKEWGSQLGDKLVRLAKRKQLRMPATVVTVKEAATSAPAPAPVLAPERPALTPVSTTPSNATAAAGAARDSEEKLVPHAVPDARSPRTEPPAIAAQARRPATDVAPKTTPTPRPTALPREGEHKKKASIVAQVDARIAESQRESARLVQFVAKEARKDLKYLPPERAAALRSEAGAAAKVTDAAPSASSDIPVLDAADIIDANNFEALPVSEPPGQTYQPPTTPSASEIYADEIERFADFDKATSTPAREKMDAKVKTVRSLKPVTGKAKTDPRDFDWPEPADKANPFAQPHAKTSFLGKKIFGGGNPTVAAKAYKPVKPKKRSFLLNSLGGIKQLLPKIFN
jgi:hypothetical protein